MTNSCPCGSDAMFDACCELYLSGKKRTPSPEALMRSRYTAFTLADIHYLDKSMRGAAKLNSDWAGTREWAQSVIWKGLKIIEAKVSPSGKRGVVEFVASYEEEGELKTIKERSVFKKHKGYWYYTDKLSSNDK